MKWVCEKVLYFQAPWMPYYTQLYLAAWDWIVMELAVYE